MSRHAIPAWIRTILGLVLGASMALNVRADTSSLAFSGNTATVTGSSGTTLNFPVSRTGDLSYDAYVTYQTVDGTAIAGTDYTAASGIIKIPAGATSASIPVAVAGSTTQQPDKSFTLQLTGASGVGPTPTFGTPLNTYNGIVEQTASPVVAADLNGDGKPDLVTVIYNGTSSVVQVQLDTAAPGATPAYSAPQFFATDGSAQSVKVADINGDGKLDLIVVDGHNNVAVLINTTAPGSTTASFAAPQYFTTNISAYSIVVADLNGDGKPDIAIGYLGDTLITVLVNTTAPGATSASFTQQQLSIDPKAFVYGMASADLNGDGKPDLVITNAHTASVEVLFNTTPAGSSTISFTAPQSLNTSVTVYLPYSVTLADLNGDGKPDIIVTDQSQSHVVVWMNATTPGSLTANFSADQRYFCGTSPYSVTAVDVNGDGKPDLITANYGDGTVSVLVNTTPSGASAASFAPAQVIANTNQVEYATTADLNGDGIPDLVYMTQSGSTSPGISIALNTTSPSPTPALFAAQQNFSIGVNTGPHGVSVTDLNGDGKPDLVVVDTEINTISVLLNNTPAGSTAASFATPQNFSAAGGPTLEADCVATGDINGDGKPDVVFGYLGQSDVSVMLNTTAPGAAAAGLAAPQQFAIGGSCRSVVVADLNGDGKPDIITTNEGANVTVLLNTTPPGAATASFVRQDFAAGSFPYYAAVADVNGDGKPDLIVVNAADNTVSVLLNTTAPGATTLSFAPQQTFATGSAPVWVAVADVNGDGEPDLIVVNSAGDGTGNTISVLLNTTAPGATTASFAPQQTFVVGASGINVHSVAVADINGDGKPDLIVSAINGNTATVLLNTTAPGATTASFAPPQAYATGQEPFSVVAADVNGDGKPDLITANATDGNVSVLLNTQYLASVTPSSVTGTIHYAITVPAVSLSSTSLAFGNQPMGSTSAVSSVTLTNSGTANLTSIGLSVSGTNPGDFSQTNNCPTSLAPNGSCSINVQFTPGALGTRSATLNISSNAASSPNTVSLSGTGTDVAATANNGGVSTTADQAVSGGLSATIAYTGQTLSYSVVSAPAHGNVSITNASTGAFTYTPTNGYAGADTFTFQAIDGAGTASNAATESVTVNDVAATANAGTATTGPDQAVSGSLSATAAYSGQILTYFVVAQPGHGSASITNSSAGAFVYTPATGYAGADSFTFRVQDQAGTYSNTATVSVTVTDIAPTANNGSAATLAGLAVSGTLSATTAYNGQALTYSVVGSPAHGTASITNASTGAYTYTPSSGFAGSDSFTFKVTDAAGTASNTATVSVTVNDRAPTANNGSVTTSADAAQTGTVLASISYTGQTFTYSIVSQPAHGSVVLNNNMTGFFTYAPATGYAGTDSFTFKATDAYGTASNPGTESETVNDIAPTISGTTAFTMTHNTSHNGSFTSTPKYSGQVLTFGVVIAPSHGTLTLNAGNGTYTYKPTTNFRGTDTFSVNVKDQWGAASATLKVNVTIK